MVLELRGSRRSSEREASPVESADLINNLQYLGTAVRDKM